MTKKQTRPWGLPLAWVGVRGGISTAYDGSLAWGRGTVAEIAKNRLDWAEKADFIIELTATAEQVHSDRVAPVTEADGGRGFTDPGTRIPATDGLMTCGTRTVLMTSHADCAPLYLYHPQHRAIALVHAGWRGTLAGIGGNAVRALRREYDVAPEELLVAVGPMITTANYPVGDDVAEQFTAKFGPNVVVKYGDRLHLDVFAALMVDLLRTGVSAARDCPRPPDTFSNPIWSSFRRDGERAGGMLAYLYLSSSMSE